MTKQAFRCISKAALAVALAASLCPAPAFAEPTDAQQAELDANVGSQQAEAPANADAQEAFQTADEAIAAAQTVTAEDGETVLLGYNPFAESNPYSVSVVPADEVPGAPAAASDGDALSASVSTFSGEADPLESALDAGWDSLQEFIDVRSLSIPVAQFDELCKRYFDHLLDQPSRFNVRFNVNAATDESRTTITAIVAYYITVDPDTFASMEAAYETNVQRALGRITDSMDDVSKVYALHDWLCDRATYNYDAISPDGTADKPDSDAAVASYPSFTSYGCMVDGLGVCQSYTLALADLLDRAGVNNAPLLVISEGHAWNLAEIDGSWYHVDATWNDGGDIGATGEPDYRYFMKSGSWFSSPTAGSNTHAGWTDESTFGWDNAFNDKNTNFDAYPWTRYAPEANRLCDFVTASSPSGLKLVVKYDALKAKEPTEFFAQAWGGSGDYLYSFQAPMSLDKLSDVDTLVDPTNAQFNSEFTSQRDGAFAFSFFVSASYRLRIGALDTRYGETPAWSASCTLMPTLNSADAPSVASIVQSVAAQCLDELGPNATDFDKALWMHDYLIDTAEYDLRYTNAEGVLARKMGNCESYHAAYCNLLKAVGVQTGRVPSVADNHVWTAVKMDGDWYQVDVTWDDENYARQPVDLRHIHFGLTDELMEFAHPGHTQPIAGYESTALANNYFIRTGAIDPHADQFTAEINSFLATGASTFSIQEKNQSYPNWSTSYDEATKSIYNSLIAYELSQRQWETTVNGEKMLATLSVSYENKSNIASGISAGTFTFSASYVPGSHEHTWSAWTTAKAATCTAAGQQKRTCSRCDASETRAVAALGHAWAALATVDKQPTCTASGQKSVHCTRCGAVKPGTTQAVSALGHSFGAWTTVKAPTTQAEGQQARTCSRCSVRETRVVAKLPSPDTKPTTPTTPTPSYKPGWEQTAGNWQYRNEDGSLSRGGWDRIGGAWYLFDGSGRMLTGWQQVGSTWYYLESWGAMAEGWAHVGGAWYYLTPGSGAMATGWRSIGGTWYYLKSWGAMATGWQQVGGTWYLLGGSGAMLTGWQYTGGSWYYLKGSGAMATGWLNLNGTWYYLKESGAMATGWLYVGGTWYWFDGSGAMATGGRWVDGTWNRFSSSGAWLG